MKVVRSFRDAELLISNLSDRIERLENATKLRPEIQKAPEKSADTEVDSTKLDINFAVDESYVFHDIEHEFHRATRFGAGVDFQAAVTMQALLTAYGSINISDNLPELQLTYNTGTPAANAGKVFLASNGNLILARNISLSGSNWNLNDTSEGGSILLIRATDMEWYYFTAGTNPRTPNYGFKLTSGNRLYNNNVAILNTQQSDPGAGPSSPSITTLGIGGTAGATYTSTEQNLINDLLTNNGNQNTNVSNLKTAVDALITCVNNIRTALRNHGLCA